MSRDFTSQKAQQILSFYAPGKKSLLFHNGAIIKNLQELGAALCVMEHEEFEYHVNDKKNDIASWIKNIVGDRKLSKTLLPFKTLAVTKVIMNRRIAELESLAFPTQEKQKAKRLQIITTPTPKKKIQKIPEIMVFKEKTEIIPSLLVPPQPVQQPSIWKKLIKVLVH